MIYQPNFRLPWSLHMSQLLSTIMDHRFSMLTVETANSHCQCIILEHSLFHSVLMAIFHHSTWTWVSRYQNVSILDFIGANGEGGGGNNWSYKTCKAPVKMSPPTNQHLVLQVGGPSCRPTTVSKH